MFIFRHKRCGHTMIMGAYMAQAIKSGDEPTAYCYMCRKHYPADDFIEKTE